MDYCVYDADLNHLRDIEADSDEQAREIAANGDTFVIYRDDDERGTRVAVWQRSWRR